MCITDHVLIGGFLALFPVFTLTTNYPLISITMRNNLQTLFEPVQFISQWKYNRFLFSALSAVPPIAVALATDNISFLVSLTGSIAGVFIQFIFPAALVYFSRRKMRKTCIEAGVEYSNPHTSPFSYNAWAFAVFTVGICGFVVAVIMQIFELVSYLKGA
jgi:succinate dehydrogenase/fumarate reductase cytochrome b subunit